MVFRSGEVGFGWRRRALGFGNKVRVRVRVWERGKRAVVEGRDDHEGDIERGDEVGD